MKLTHTLLAAATASAMILSLSACNNSGNGNQPANQSPNGAPTTPMTVAPPGGAAPNTMGQPPAATTAQNPGMAMPATTSSTPSYGTASTNWFGGPIYHGQPNLEATAALVRAGGGADNFNFSKALVAMLGQKTVNAEVAKLSKQYGKQNVDDFVNGMTFAVNDALKRANQAGIQLPQAPSDLKGKKLAKALVSAGTAPDGTFWAGYMFDHTISHKLHNKVMADIDAKDGHAADGNVHKILNQAMYDVAQALGDKNVKLASFH